MLPTQTVAAIEKATARPMISHTAPTTRLRRGSRVRRIDCSLPANILIGHGGTLTGD